MKSALIILALFCAQISARGQTEPSDEFSISLRGRRQTGNLSQLGLNPALTYAIHRGKSSTQFQLNYDFLRVAGNQVVSDLWFSSFFKTNTKKPLYFMSRAFYGFAKSYRIDRSLIGGAGLGAQLIGDGHGYSLQVNAFAGYMNINYDGPQEHSAMAAGTFVKSFLPLIVDKLNLSWQLDTYHSLQNQAFWGFSNRLILIMPMSDNFNISITHSTIFNNVVSDSIQRTNTLVLFGFTYQTNSNKIE